MKILISGGGIAGLTIANLLYRQGHQPIIIDKASAFSNAGFVISLKSFGVEIIKELGLEEKMRLYETRSNLVNFRTASGKLVRELSFDTINKNLTDSILAPRANIQQVLYEAVKDDVEIRFNTTIREVTQNENEVTALLSDNSTIKADLLVVAEGIRSATRKLIWDHSSVEDFNIFYAAGRLQGKHDYQVGNYDSYQGQKKILVILPLSEDELAIQCYIHSTVSAENLQSLSHGLLTDTFKGFEEKAMDIIQKLESKGAIFSDKIGMVHEPVLHKDRIVLLGDAGYCPTSFSGMGASLSIFGAKALVHYISNYPENMGQALENYNNLMQPIIQKFQKNASTNVKTYLPMNKVSLFIKNLLFKYIPSSFVSKKMRNELSLTVNQRRFIIE